MKRNILIVFFLMIVFLSGWMGACILLQKQFSQRQALLREQALQEVDQWKDRVKALGGRFYGNSLIYPADVKSGIKARLEEFTPTEDTEFISLAYVGGYSEGDKRLVLTGKGELYSEFKGERQLLSRIPSDRRTAFFRKVITSGILNYSVGVLSLKMEVLSPERYLGLTDVPLTRIQIHIPELEIEKEIEVIAPETQIKNFPDIIEFRKIVDLQIEMFELVPENHPVWKKLSSK